MSRPNITVDGGESARSRLTSTRLLASAHSCAQRVQLSLEGLGCVSNLLLLTGVGAGLVASFLSGLIIDGGLSLASNERLHQATSGFAVELP
jgi:hypothetical protein